MERQQLIELTVQTYFLRHDAKLCIGPDPQARPVGARLGRKELIANLRVLGSVGIDHLALNFRQSSRPPREVIDEIAAEVIPALTGTEQVRAA